jgi:hypothetical protein
MKRRQLLMLAGGTAASTVALGGIAPPAKAFFPLLIRFLIGQGAREALQKRQKQKKLKKSPNNSQKKSLNNKFTKKTKIKTLSTQAKKVKIRSRR